MRKGLCITLATLLLAVPLAGGLTACDKTDENAYNIKVWVGEGTDTLTKRQIEEFNKTNEWGVKFNATIEIVSESKAVGNAVSKPASCADIFCFAQDQLARAVQAKLLAKPNSASVAAIQENADENSIASATMGNTLCAFPMTADNAYFMYYDKRVIPEDHAGSLEDIIADCEAAGKNFSLNLTTNGGSWYAASFFYATGCVSEWTADEEGKFTAYNDTFNSDAGVKAIKGMQKLLKSSCYQESTEVSDFNAAIPSAAVVSGVWGYKAASQALGENLGIAPLPKFTVDGSEYQLVSYLGCKFMGVKPQSDPYRAAYLQGLARYLTSYECQKQRFEEVGWGPSDKKAAAEVSSPALDILNVAKTTPQGQYPTNWWANVEIMTGSAKTAGSDDASLRALLEKYAGDLNDLLGSSEE